MNPNETVFDSSIMEAALMRFKLENIEALENRNGDPDIRRKLLYHVKIVADSILKELEDYRP